MNSDSIFKLKFDIISITNLVNSIVRTDLIQLPNLRHIRLYHQRLPQLDQRMSENRCYQYYQKAHNVHSFILVNGQLCAQLLRSCFLHVFPDLPSPVGKFQ